MKRIRFNKEDDEIILNTIKEFPNNISYACELASKKLSRSSTAVYSRYYTKLKKQNTILTVTSNNVRTIYNQKNALRPKNDLTDEQQYDIIVLLLDKIGPQYKQNIIKYLLKI